MTGVYSYWSPTRVRVPVRRSSSGGEEGVANLIQVSRKAEASGNEIIPAAGPEGAEGVLMPIGGYYYEPSRGAIPEYDNKWNQASWEGTG